MNAGQYTETIAYSAANNSVYVMTEGTPSTVIRIDANSFSEVASHALTRFGSDIAISQDGTEVYVAENLDIPGGNLGQIPILNRMTLAPIGQIPNMLPLSIISAN